MDIMELGAIGELVGGVAVVASLLYVGLQIRQSARAQNAAAVESHLDYLLTMNNLLAGDADLARITSEGVQDRASLDPTEYFRFHLVMRGIFLGFDSVRVKRTAGMVNDSLWYSTVSFGRGMVRLPEIVRWWERNARDFSPEMRSFVADEFRVGDGTPGSPTARS